MFTLPHEIVKFPEPDAKKDKGKLRKQQALENRERDYADIDDIGRLEAFLGDKLKDMESV